MTTKNNQFGGRYLIQDQDHMGQVPAASDKASARPLTGTPSAGWVQPAKRPAAKTHSHAATR